MARTEAANAQARKPARETALDILKEDHRKVDGIFAEYEQAHDDDDRRQLLAGMACAELTIHAQVEEELFYSALRDAMDDGELLDEAEVEHGSIKQLVAALQSSGPGDRLFDANMKVLSEYVKHHVEEEEGGIFPKAKQARDLDLVAMGEEMRRRKVQLREELGLGPEEESRMDPERTHHSTTSRHI